MTHATVDRDSDGVHFGTTRSRYRLLQCEGCGEVSLRCDYKHRNKFVDAEVSLDSFTKYYPPIRLRKMPEWSVWLRMPGADAEKARQIGDLLTEVYSALDNELLSLAGMGIRVLAERVLHLRISDSGGFDLKLDQFMQLGLLSQVQRAYLEAVIEVGHAAIHRSHVPSSGDVERCLDVIESLIHTLLVQPRVSEAIASSAPKRVRPVRRREK